MPREYKGENVLFWICLIVHLLDVFAFQLRQATIRLFLYITIALLAWVMVFKHEDGSFDIKDLFVPLILSTIAFLVPYLVNVIPAFSNLFSLQTVLVFFPVWVIFVVFVIDGTKLLNVARYVFVFVFILLFIPAFAVNISADFGLTEIESAINAPGIVREAFGQMRDSASMLWENLKEAFLSIPRMIDNMIYYGTHGHLPTDEEETKVPVGIYIESLRRDRISFYQGHPITVLPYIRGRTLDDPINVSLSCYIQETILKDFKDKRPGTISPDEIKIYSEHYEALSCSFESNIQPGNHDVVINAKFGFSTDATLTRHFMMRSDIIAFEQDNIDYYRHYGITREFRVSEHSQGPMAIAIVVGQSNIVGIGEQGSRINMEIELRNKWDGLVQNVTELKIKVPRGLRIDSCTTLAISSEERENGYNVYTIESPWERIGPLGRIVFLRSPNTYYTFGCSLVVEDPAVVLGGSPIHQRNFFVRAKYIYEIEESQPIEVKEVEGVPVDAKLISQARIDELERAFDANEEKYDTVCGDDGIIKECSHYGDGAPGLWRIGEFTGQEWCEADPCGYNCFSFFSGSGQDLSFHRCYACEEITRRSERVYGAWCTSYKIQAQCEADPCGFENCKWDSSEGCIKKEETEPIDLSDCESPPIDQVKSLVIQAARRYNVPENLALALAKTESNFNQCQRGEDGEVGVMQILPSTASDHCQGMNLRDINQNIDCGFKYLINRYNLFCDGQGPRIYENSVRNNCKNSVYVERYLSYQDDCWKKALRGYNGLGCGDEKVAGYVERVYGNRV